MPYNILLVDDDVSQARVVENVIKNKMHYNTKLINNGQEAIDALTSSHSADYDLVLLDMNMPAVSGIDVLKSVKHINPNLPIIIRSGYDDMNTVVDAMKAGAADFIRKIDDNKKLLETIEKTLRKHIINEEVSLIKKARGGKTNFSAILGDSVNTREMIALGKKVAASEIPVLIEGESGVGKELLSRAIHESGSRKDMPFIAVNCGAIPENLVESILFGHEKGAFTGAVYKTFGKFREADGGTIFLDEVGELSPDIQVKLLRVLQDGEIDPVGSKKPIKVNVRVISATNRNLNEEIKKGTFREDLFYRLSVFPIHAPSLRDRKGDIQKLVDYFVKSFSETENKKINGITKEAKDMLVKYSWPGNIRQLKNIIFRAIVLCESDILDVKDFPQVSNDLRAVDLGGSYEGQDYGFIQKALNGNSMLMQNEDGNFRSLADIERDIIVTAIKYYNGHMSEVARRLNIGRSTLYRKLEEYGIESNEAKQV